MPVETIEQFESAMKEFIKRSNPDLDTNTLERNQNLFNSGILHSFKLPELVSFLSDELNLEVPLEDVEIDAFQSIDAMYANLVEKN